MRGEAVDPAAIEAEGRAAVRAIVKKQIETGLDVIDDGEQSRESFVLYMRHRLTGLGGNGTRPMHADLDDYPQYKREFQQRVTSADKVSNRTHLPKAIGAVGYADPSLIEAECADFRAALDAANGGFTEAFLTAPSPGIIASIVQNEHYDTFERYLDALGAALQVEYEAIVAAGFLLQLDCPDLALERHTSYRDRPLADFVGFVERSSRRSTRRCATFRPTRCGCTCAGAITRARTTATSRCATSCRRSCRRMRARSSCPSPIRATRMSFACSRRCRSSDDQLLIAGVIDTLTNFVEHPEVVADRIERIAAVVGDRERVLAATGLRLRHLGRNGARRRGRRLGEAARAARRGRDWRRGVCSELGGGVATRWSRSLPRLQGEGLRKGRSRRAQ